MHLQLQKFERHMCFGWGRSICLSCQVLPQSPRRPTETMDSSQIRDRLNHHSQISHFIPQEPEGIISSNALLFHIVIWQMVTKEAADRPAVFSKRRPWHPCLFWIDLHDSQTSLPEIASPPPNSSLAAPGDRQTTSCPCNTEAQSRIRTQCCAWACSEGA